MPTPTEQAYRKLQDAYDCFHTELFGGARPPCLITFQRKNRTYGYCSGERWQHHHGTPSRQVYPNRQWTDKIAAIGLAPSHTGRPVSRRTGQQMSLLRPQRLGQTPYHPAVRHLPPTAAGRGDAMLIVLHKHVPERNEHRFYTLQLAPNLFGAWSLIRTWGRIGTPGQQRIDWHDTEEAAAQARDRLLQAKQRRGYRLCSGPA